MFDAYFICTAPRSGSTLLCNLLSATGVAGAPDSFYRTVSKPWWAAKWALPPCDSTETGGFERTFLEAARSEGTAATPVFGMRLMQNDLPNMLDRLSKAGCAAQGDRARIQQAFGRTLFISLSRADKVAQAVSYVRAQQSGLWHIAPDGTELERLPPSGAPGYDSGSIREAVAEFEAFDAGWDVWFERQGISPVRVGYDKLCAGHCEVLGDLLYRLGQDRAKARGVEPGVAKLSDETSARWIALFCEEVETGA